MADWCKFAERIENESSLLWSTHGGVCLRRQGWDDKFRREIVTRVEDMSGACLFVHRGHEAMMGRLFKYNTLRKSDQLPKFLFGSASAVEHGVPVTSLQRSPKVHVVDLFLVGFFTFGPNASKIHSSRRTGRVLDIERLLGRALSAH